MGKTNLFTLFAIVIVVVVAAELLVNDYTSYPDLQEKMAASEMGSNGQGNVLGAGASESGEEGNAGGNLINFEEDSLSPKSTSDLNGIVSQNQQSMNENTDEQRLTNNLEIDTDSPLISFGVVDQVGFNNVVLQRIPFNGIMFQKVDMRDFQSVPIIQQNLLQNNRDWVAEFYEMHAESQLLANEIYLLIKEKAATSIEAGINETNEFANGSFYINYADRSNTAFLVVKVRESVYAFVYKKELHPFVKSLIQLL